MRLDLIQHTLLPKHQGTIVTIIYHYNKTVKTASDVLPYQVYTVHM